MSIPVDTYFTVTPGSNVDRVPGAYATLGNTDLFFYVTETNSLRVVNMNSSAGSAAPGNVSFALAQNVKWMDVITMPGNGIVQIYYSDNNGVLWYSPYVTYGGPTVFKQVQGVSSVVNFSTIYSPNSNPTAFLLMVDDGLKHTLYVGGDPAYNSVLSTTITYNNSLNALIYISRPSIAMHPSDTHVITVTCQQTVISTSVTSVGFYEIKVSGIS
jgi:hypothetical protein